jgi:AAA+ superfamily predicted ATPase
MTGMVELKKAVRSIATLISAQKKRKEAMLTEAHAQGEALELKTDQKQGNHIILTDNHGTGKTTVVCLLAKLFKAIGALPTDNLVEVNGNDLKGTYIGQSKDKVNDYYRQAIEGVLFIDEAYVLANDKGPVDSYAKEAAETLMTHLENSRDKFICIAAGYETNMGLFLDKLNPGMRSRFNHFINIVDYSASRSIANKISHQKKYSKKLVKPQTVKEITFALQATMVLVRLLLFDLLQNYLRQLIYFLHTSKTFVINSSA